MGQPSGRPPRDVGRAVAVMLTAFWAGVALTIAGLYSGARDNMDGVLWCLLGAIASYAVAAVASTVSNDSR